MGAEEKITRSTTPTSKYSSSYQYLIRRIIEIVSLHCVKVFDVVCVKTSHDRCVFQYPLTTSRTEMFTISQEIYHSSPRYFHPRWYTHNG